MNKPTTWYEIKRGTIWKNGDCIWGWEIRPLQVVKQTPKSIMVLETWEATAWLKAGSRLHRRLFDGNQFDDLEAANAAVRDHLQAEYDKTVTAQMAAAKALREWKDVIA